MSVSSPTSSTLTTNVAVTGTARETTGDQYVRIRVGESELAIGTETLAGVFQVSNQNRLTGNGTVLTAKGEFPLVDLSKVLKEKLGIQVSGTEAQALVALENEGQMRMLLADSVSRPIKTKPEHVYPMPRFCFQRRRESELLRSVINFDPSLQDPGESLRFAIDPDVVFGKPASSDSRANVLPQQAIHAITAGNQAAGRSSQLLAFIPEDIEASAVEHVFCLPLSAVAEVVTMPPSLNTFGANEVFEGFALWRTVPVPIVRLGKVFGFDSSEETSVGRRLIIARATGNRFVGIYTKPQMQTMKVPSSAPGNSRPFVGRPFLGCFSTEHGELVVPDIDRILSNNF